MDNSTPTPPFQWNDENTARVIELDAQAVPASKIAQEIGAPTRAVVIGKIRRLGLRQIRGDRGNATRKKFGNGAHHTKTPARKGLQYLTYKRATLHANGNPHLPNGSKDLLELKNDECRWIVTDRPPHLFCAAKKWGTSSYCAAHTAKAWRNFEEK